MNQLTVVILAAGMGTRMNSKVQKILHDVGGKPMVKHVVEAAVSASDSNPVLVVGAGGQGVRDMFGESADYVIQAEQLGTGHAVRVCTELLKGKSKQIAVAVADMPLLTPDTINKLAQRQVERNAAVVLMSVTGDPSSSYGRIVRNAAGNVQEIVEFSDAKKRPNAEELVNITEHNGGQYCFDADWLWANLDKLPLRQARSGVEYYLTDMIGLAIEQGRIVDAVIAEDADEALGAGTRAEMVGVERAFRQRAVSRVMAAGVTIVDPDSTYIDPDVTVGKDTIIWPNTYLRGNTTIGEDCVIGPSVVLTDITVRDGTTIDPFTNR